MTQAAEAGEDNPSWSLAPLHVIGSLMTLCTVAFVQPLLDLLGRNAAFLVAHDAGPVDVVLLPIVLAIVVPLVLAAVVLLLRRASHRLAALLHAGALLVFGAMLVLVVGRLSGVAGAVPGAALVAAGAVLGAIVPWAYRRSAGFRRAVTVAAVSAPVVVAMFLFATPARALVTGGADSGTDVDVPPDAPPVVVVIFDEFPVASLLDADGEVDAEAYPAFARLSADGTFFRNATTVAMFTGDAVPAGLTGHYPDLSDLPAAADHPDNLLALLADGYELHVEEPLTQLCPPGRCRRDSTPLERYSTTFRDLGVVASHVILPPDLTTGLPPINQGWRDFGADAVGKKAAIDARFWETRETNPAVRFRQFIDDIVNDGRPRVHFIHTLLPHHPFRYLPDGRPYSDSDEVPGIDTTRWNGDPWEVVHSYQRHLLQVQLADRLLGELLDRLEQQGLYDHAVISVFSDHGISFTHGAQMRGMRADTVGEILAVPLLMKAPGLTEGETSDAPVELVDVAPTVLDAIGVDIPDGVDGRSLLTGEPERTSKRLHVTSGVLDYPPEGEEKWPIVERKAEWFTHDGPYAFPYNVTPSGQQHLLGDPVPERSPATIPGVQVELVNPTAWDDVRLDAPSLPVLVEGRVPGIRGHRPALAIGVNGTIAAVAVVEDPDDGLHAMIPTEALRPGRNDITFWLVQSYGLVRLPVSDTPAPRKG